MGDVATVVKELESGVDVDIVCVARAQWRRWQLRKARSESLRELRLSSHTAEQ
jgi:hypothetical protein